MLTYKKKYHSKLMEIPEGIYPYISQNFISDITDKEFKVKGLTNSLYNYLVDGFSEKYIYLDMGEDNLSSWYHFEDFTRHIDLKDRKKYLFPFYRQITNDTINYHIAIYCGFRLRQPVWHKYVSNRPKPKFFYAFWEKPGKYHDYNPGPYDRGAYYFSNCIRLYLQKQNDFNVTEKIIKVNKELYLYNNKILDIKYKLYNKNMETYKIRDIIKSCYKH